MEDGISNYAVASFLMLPAFAPPLPAQTLLVEYEGIVSLLDLEGRSSAL